eukprot:scaffold4583_cov81-Skeletonema_marinoi.AAC.1
MHRLTPTVRRLAAAKSSKNILISKSKRCFASASPTSWDADTNDSTNTNSLTKLFNPTDDHAALREMVRSFTEREVEPQALEYNRINNLAVNANDEQLALFMPGICDGSKIGGMCMSEPNAGTDVLGMKSNAVYDSSRDGFILNGTKMWITNGTLTGKETGDLFLVYARTGTEKRSDITQFVVEKGLEGFNVGQKITDKLGMRASPTAELVFENVFLPAKTHVVGDVNGATLCMMRNLEIER